MKRRRERAGSGRGLSFRGSDFAGGMTLIEVMLAVLILSVGLTVLLTGMSRCLAVFRLSKNNQTAQWVFDMAELEHPLVRTNDVKGLEVDETEYEDGFTFSREVEDDEDEDGLYVLREKVAWSARGRQTSEEVVMYVLQPEE